MEVLTLQIGNFANHVGAHFWNLESELAAREEECSDDAEGPPVDFGRLHYQVEHYGEVSWHPRLLLVDSKGATGSVQAYLETAETGDTKDVLWDYATMTISTEQDHVEESDAVCDQFLGDGEQADVDETDPSKAAGETATLQPGSAQSMQSWTDYLNLHLSSSSICEIGASQHGVSTFPTFFDGLQVQGTLDEERILESARQQLEMCDRMDAVHAIVDTHNGFTGVADVALRWLHEEAPKSGRLVMAVQPSQEGADPDVQDGGTAAQQREACLHLSAAFSYAGLMDMGVDVWVPGLVPLWAANRAALPAYESSALLAAALETATLPYRLQGGHQPRDFLSTLMPAKRPAAGLLQALPLPLPESGFGPNGPVSASLNFEHFWDLSAVAPCANNPFSSIMLRGGTPRDLVGLCNGLPANAGKLSFHHPRLLPMPGGFPQGAGASQLPAATILHATACAKCCTPLRRMASVLKRHQRSALQSSICQRFGVDSADFAEAMETLTEHMRTKSDDDSDVDL